MLDEDDEDEDKKTEEADDEKVESPQENSMADVRQPEETNTPLQPLVEEGGEEDSAFEMREESGNAPDYTEENSIV